MTRIRRTDFQSVGLPRIRMNDSDGTDARCPRSSSRAYSPQKLTASPNFPSAESMQSLLFVRSSSLGVKAIRQRSSSVIVESPSWTDKPVTTTNGGRQELVE